MDKRRPEPVLRDVNTITNPLSGLIGASVKDQMFRLTIPKNTIDAKAYLRGGEFIVQEGSIVRHEWIGGSSGYADLHQILVVRGIIAKQNNAGIFTESYAFNSPSAAAAAVTGRSTNGRLEWKVDGTMKSYGEWDSEQLAQVPL